MSLKHSLKYGAALGALVGAALVVANPAAAQTSVQVDSLQQQIQQLQQQLQSVQTQVQQTQQMMRVQAPAVQDGVPLASSVAPNGGIQLGSVNLKFGGFTEFATIFRTRNEVADVGSDFNGGIPFGNSPKFNETELRFSARQSRISGLISGDVNKDTHLAAYLETDFLAAPDPSNARESNSFSPRVRHFYATVDENAWGFHFLAGQEWSLLTTNTSGIIPRNEQIPLTIDAQYSVGFNWTRNPQARFVEDFGNGIWAGLSIESPQASIGGAANSLNGTAGVPIAVNLNPNANNPGDQAGLFSNNQTFSTDTIPDVVAKLAFDTAWGHYELKGIGRFFSDRASGNNNTTIGGGLGGAATVPVVPKIVDLQLSGLAGYGIGRYGSGQLNDVTFTTNGALVALPEAQVLLGLIGHPSPGTDLYLYAGYEQVDRTASTGTIGYGVSTVNNAGCFIEFGACGALTHRLGQVTAGFWQDLYKGNYGRVALGAQGSYEKKFTFTGTGGANGPAPNVNEGIVMTSFRYYPF